jgi:VanZ family protein
LLVQVPETPGLGDVEGFSLRTLIGKSLHVGAYALLAVLSGWLRPAPRYRWLLAYLVMAHATATEVAQTTTGYRTGELTDVALDHVGIALGMLCAWRWWCAPAAAP